MNESDHPLLNRLKHSLQLLAAPADRQIELLPIFVVGADEIALDFSNSYGAVMSNLEDALSADQLNALRTIDTLFEEMSGSMNAELWTDDALRREKVWAQTRLLAEKALSEFGWSVEDPPDNRHEFVPGS